MRKKVPENIYIVDESMYFASRLAPKWNFFCDKEGWRLWQYRLWSFQGRDTKLKRILAKSQNARAHFSRVTFFLITLIFRSHFFLKWYPIFDSLPLLQFPTLDSFLLACWFLAKNLSNFVSLAWKLHNQYCHSVEQSSEHR